MQKRGQSFTEYALLVGVSIIGILLALNSLLNGPKNTFTSHFNTAKSRIVGAGD